MTKVLVAGRNTRPFTYLDTSGAVVVNYIYDAWGNNAVTDKDGNDVDDGIGKLNPFRYRGYYYDDETGLYYLQTRYYDPEIGRFISQDSIEYADPETINGLNLYAYCGNNPVMRCDYAGCSWSLFDEIADFFKNLYNGIVVPISGWINQLNGLIDTHIISPIKAWESEKVAPAIFNFFYFALPNFFTKTLPDFFVNTFWNDWMVDKVWNKGLVVAWNWIDKNIDDILLWAGVATAVVGIICYYIPVPGAQVAGGILGALGLGVALVQVVRRYQ